jgi:hypothetical protein
VTFAFPSVSAFRAADPRRIGALEVDFGGPWRTAAFGPSYRAAWLPATGELVLIRLGALPAGATRVELIAQVAERGTLAEMLSGWREAVGNLDSIRWLRARVAAAHPLKRRDEPLPA